MPTPLENIKFVLPIRELFSTFKPGAKEATGSEITLTPPAGKDPRFYRSN